MPVCTDRRPFCWDCVYRVGKNKETKFWDIVLQATQRPPGLSVGKTSDGGVGSQIAKLPTLATTTGTVSTYVDHF